MFVNPMLLPFVFYQRWLETVVLPYLDRLEEAAVAASGSSRSFSRDVGEEAESFGSEVRQLAFPENHPSRSG